MNEENKIIADYYSGKIKTHGANPSGVDWNGKESQYLRFDQLTKVLSDDLGVCADIGCGYGALVEYLQSRKMNTIKYLGYDLSLDMIEEARRCHPESKASFFHIERLEDMPDVDFSIASGIFNVRQDIDDTTWTDYILKTLDIINAKTGKGFAFNLLTAYSDEDRKRNYLYYASPEEIFKHCKENYSRNVALLHDYNLYEFTIIVRK